MTDTQALYFKICAAIGKGRMSTNEIRDALGFGLEQQSRIWNAVNHLTHHEVLVVLDDPKARYKTYKVDTDRLNGFRRSIEMTKKAMAAPPVKAKRDWLQEAFFGPAKKREPVES